MREGGHFRVLKQDPYLAYNGETQEFVVQVCGSSSLSLDGQGDIRSWRGVGGRHDAHRTIGRPSWREMLAGKEEVNLRLLVAPDSKGSSGSVGRFHGEGDGNVGNLCLHLNQRGTLNMFVCVCVSLCVCVCVLECVGACVFVLSVLFWSLSMTNCRRNCSKYSITFNQEAGRPARTVQQNLSFPQCVHVSL